MVLLLSISFLYGCKNSKQEIVTDSIKVETPIEQELPVEVIKIDYDTTQCKEITERSGIVLDIIYATNNNFTKNQIYPCSRCFLRPVMADKILILQEDINKKYGINLKLFDCYRPRPARQNLWDIVPDTRYVTPPNKGSMHNRGLAVDMTLVGKDVKELDMGTEYDFFEQEAYTTNTDLPKYVQKNRKAMAKLMETHGMKGIRTEWWHFSLKTKKAPLDAWE